MKKIIGFILLVSVVVLSACNMDKRPRTQIPQKITSYTDAENIRNGMYINFKSITTGMYLTASDYQSDLFDATSYFGNFNGQFFRWLLEPTDATITSMWYGWYSAIAHCNFLIDGIAALDTADYTSAEKANLTKFVGEAYWMRAYCYYNLAINWCERYDPITADDMLGLPLQITFAPTSDRTKYPGRSSLFDTFKRITDDLDVAETNIQTLGVVNSYYVTVDAITALRARVALYMQDWNNAAIYAQGLTTKYELISDPTEFASLWTNDVAIKEVILMSQMTSHTDLGGSTGELFLYDVNNIGIISPRYVPTQTVLNHYASDDIRLNGYFRLEHISESAGEGDLYVIVKYPGNPDLQVPGNRSNNYSNKGKVFRVSEMYLIAAEALAMQGGKDVEASMLLNTLKSARSASYTTTSYTGADLIVAIRNERMIELYAEGIRLIDLKRWQLAMDRETAAPQPVPALIFSGSEYGDLRVENSDTRFIWPIPKREIDANPQIKDQQNSGYTQQ